MNLLIANDTNEELDLDLIREKAEKTIKEVLRVENISENAEVSLSIVDKETIHKLNKDYRNVDRERIENYLFKLTYDLIVGVVEEKSKGLNITEEDKKFIADFYKYGFVGIMLEWIREGMKENIEDLVRMMDLTLRDTVTTSIHNFQKNNIEK